MIMALSKYTGGFTNSTYTPLVPVSSLVPPTPPPVNLSSYLANYTSYTPTMPLSSISHPSQPSAAEILKEVKMSSEWRRRRRQQARSGLMPAGDAEVAYDPDKDKHRWRKDHSVKRRHLEEETKESSESVEEVSVQCGDEATLPCSAPRPDSVDGLEWRRPDLEEYVYLYKDGRPELDEQHQDYRGRCELKDGTATLLLQNVSSSDSGTYECRFVKHSPSVRKRAIIKNGPVSVVRLSVKETGACAKAEGVEVAKGDPEGEHDEEGILTHLYVALGVVGVIGFLLLLFGVINRARH